MHKSAIGTALFLVLAATSAALGQTWSEGSDAGDLPHTAQVPTGVGDLITIEGVLDFGNVDMYQIHLTGGGTFSALAQGLFPSYVNPQLFLFDAQGLGVYGNEDLWPPSPELSPGASLLPSGTALTPVNPGTYFLAISTRYLEPISASGFIFPCVGCNPSGTSAPTGPGGEDPITGWSGQPFSAGSYAIALTGAQFVQPAPTPLSLLEDLRAQVEELPFAGRNGLVETIDGARERLERSQSCEAARMLVALRARVEALRHAGVLEPGPGSALLSSLDEVLAALETTLDESDADCTA